MSRPHSPIPPSARVPRSPRSPVAPIPHPGPFSRRDDSAPTPAAAPTASASASASASKPTEERTTWTDNANLEVAYEYVPVHQNRLGRKHISYQLDIRQEPVQARMCGVGEKSDRRPVDPTPIIQLIVTDPQPDENKRSGMTYMQNPYYFLFACLVSGDKTDDELYFTDDGRTRFLSGTSVSSLYHLKDVDNSDAAFFVFPDLGVRKEGRYRLKLTLFEIVEHEVFYCTTKITKVFTVFAPKKFPGMKPASELSHTLSNQGLKIRVRKDGAVSSRRTKRKSSGLSEDEQMKRARYSQDYSMGPMGPPPLPQPHQPGGYYHEYRPMSSPAMPPHASNSRQRYDYDHRPATSSYPTYPSRSYPGQQPPPYPPRHQPYHPPPPPSHPRPSSSHHPGYPPHPPPLQQPPPHRPAPMVPHSPPAHMHPSNMHPPAPKMTLPPLDRALPPIHGRDVPLRDIREFKEVYRERERDPRDLRDHRDHHDMRDPRDHRDHRDVRMYEAQPRSNDPRSNDPRHDPRHDPRDPRDHRDYRDHRLNDVRDPREPREFNSHPHPGPNGPQDPRDYHSHPPPGPRPPSAPSAPEPNPSRRMGLDHLVD